MDVVFVLMPWLLALMVFAAIGVAVAALLWPRHATAERIQQIALFGPGRNRPPGAASSAPRSTTAAQRSVGLEGRITRRLAQAGMTVSPMQWVLACAAASAVPAVLFFVMFGLPAALAGAILGWIGTSLYRRIRVERRGTAFGEQLPDALQLVIGSLRSGFGLPHAIEGLVREAPVPVGPEFGRALAEYRLGGDISDALDRVVERTKSEDLSWAVMAIRIQREVGGNLAEVLQTTVDTMRERARLRRQVKALSAEGRLSAIILIALPVLLLVWMLLFRADYLRPLFTDTIGVVLLIMGGGLLAVGVVWMLRVVRVDV
ncbi:MAG: type II secretion system F family protein [Micromonosporaceae bacterium]